VLLDGRLDCDREFEIQLVELTDISGTPGARCRDAELTGHVVSPALVPDPLDAVPTRARHAKLGGECVAVAGKGRHVLISGWVQDPSVQSKSPPDVEDRVDCALLIEEVGDADVVRGVPGDPADRDLVVDNAHRDAAPSEAPDDAEPGEVPADDDGTDRLRARVGTGLGPAWLGAGRAVRVLSIDGARSTPFRRCVLPNGALGHGLFALPTCSSRRCRAMCEPG